jgi:hypothetical protein
MFAGERITSVIKLRALTTAAIGAALVDRVNDHQHPWRSTHYMASLSLIMANDFVK